MTESSTTRTGLASPPGSLLAALRARGVESADRRAFLFLDGNGNEAEELCWGELDRRVRSVAAALDARGARGERALLLFPPGLDFVVAFLGCLRVGVVAVPAYPPRPNRPQRLRAVARDSGARLVLAAPAIAAAAGRLCAGVPELGDAAWMTIEGFGFGGGGGEAWDGPDPEPDAPAFLQYTSGSTADPKGVVVTHASLAHNEEAIRLGFGQTAASVVVGWLPLYHDMGLIGNVLQPLYTGGAAVLLSPLAFLQRPRLWLEAIDRYRATTSGGPDFAYDLCVRKVGEAERAGLDLSSWSVAFNGAEPVRAGTLERFSTAFASCGFRREAFFPCYGLAEATLFAAGGDPAGLPVVRAFRTEDLARHDAVEAATDEDARFLVGCGRPSPGQRIAVVDPESAVLCASGRIGEIWISGPSVASGYWGKPADSERLFRARTVGGDGPFLRTGDLGFLAADGELFVTGRLKDLIILRGRNHYPQDLEATVERVDPALRPGCGAAFSIERGGEERLVVVQEVEHGRPGAPEPSVLAEAVRRAVADEHEVAVEEVVLLRSGTLPKTSSGKVRRRACREGYLAGSLAAVGRSEPATDEESAGLGSDSRAAVGDLIVAEAARVLRRDRRGLAPDQPLTALGLDSLAAVELKAAVEARTGVTLSLAGLLSGASLASVEAEVRAGLAAARPFGASGVEAGPPLGEHPLSAGQEALWLFDRLAPEAAVYNLAAAARVEGGPDPLDPEALGRALQALTDRHPVLRTTFSLRSGEPRQIVHQRLAVDFRVEDGEKVTDAVLAAEAYRPFDLEQGPLLRVRLWPLEAPEPEGWLLLLAVHHLVTDFLSMGIFVRELAALYREATGGGPAELAPLPLGHTDYVRWQERILAGEEGERLLAYWRRQLAGGLPVLELAPDLPRPAVPAVSSVSETAGVSHGLVLAPDLSDRLRALGHASGTTLFVTLLAGLQALLSRTTGQDEAVIGSPMAGRDAAPFLPVMGYFVNPVALRLSAAGDPTWRELLAAAQAVALAAFEHRALPFPRVAAALSPEREAGRPPVFQTLFVFQKAERPEERSLAAFALGMDEARMKLAGLTLVSVPLAESRAPFDLTLTAADAEAGLPIVLQLHRDRFDPVTVERRLKHFANLLRALAEEPGGRVAAAGLLSEAERRQLAALNRTAVELPRGLCLPDLFAAQVERTPEGEALVAGGERLTYRELARRAGLLARRLRALGVGPETRVGVCAGRSAGLVAALLGVHRAGGAYVPLDPAQPAERLSWMLADSGAAVLLAEERLAADLLAAGAPAGCRVAFLDPSGEMEDAEGIADTADTVDTVDTAGLPLQPQNLAYVLYTSGSTGRPKGVAIEQRSAVAFVHWARQAFSDAELSGVLAATSAGFDLSVFELFVPLSWGGRVILAGDALALPDLPAAGEVRLVNTVPSVFAELLREQGAAGLPGSVVTVNLAGEPLPLGLVGAIRAGRPAVRVLNLYGPSEATTYSTFAVVPRGDQRAPAIGRPIANTRAHVLDRRLLQVPSGVPGELYLGGEGLARGYLGRPDLTAERFVPDPFEAGERLYRTGDRVRRRLDGELEFLGRVDDQVKIRGVRIEPAEVEAALLSLPGVCEAAVLAHGEESGDRRLIAYAVAGPGTEVDAAALRGALLRSLPRAMVPATFVLLPGLPLTPNGKVDRRALARLAPEAPAGEDGTALRTPMEELLAGIWAEVLGIEQVGPGDDFFALGGHSLLALRVQARLRERLGAELPLADFFRFSTLAEQARKLAPGQADHRPPLRPAPPEQTVFPLSFAQARLWLLERLRPGTAVYHMAGAARLTGPLDAAALGQALAQVVRRHDALRTRFREVDGIPVQEILPAAPAETELPLVCLAGLDPERREAEAERISRAEARRPFDLTSALPWRALLLRPEPCSHLLLLTLHHIAADEESLTILARELAALYGGLVAGRAASLPELPLRAVDFALWQREWLRGEALERRLAWWRDELADLPIVELPADRPRPEIRSSQGALVAAVLPPALAGALAALGRREGATLFMILLAAFQIVLERTSGEPEVPVGCPVSSRDREPLLPLVGFFVNTLVLRSGEAAEPTFRGLLRRAREATVRAWEHGDVPFELLVQELRPERGVGRNPFFEVIFALQRPPRGWQAGDLAFAPRTVPTGTAKFDLTLFGVEEEGELSLVLEYATDLFDRPIPMRLLGYLEILLAAASAEPGRPLAELPLLSPAERQQILEWGLGEELDPGALPVHERFERWAEREPGNLAVSAISEISELSYGELDRRANRLARHLRGLGVGPDVPVAIRLERSAEEVMAALAVLKAGGAYTPLDPDLPEERLAALLETAGIPILVTRRRGAGNLPFMGTVVELDGADAAAISRQSAKGLGVPVTPGNLAYVIFTSGSTGTPKGVAIPHAGLAGLVAWHLRAYGVTPADRAARVAGLGFDAAVWELWPYLAAGASLHLPPEPVRASPPALAEWLVTRRISLCFLPTPLAEAVLALDEPLAGGALRALLTGGDRLRRGPRTEASWQLVNHYGPTECTVVATSAPVPAGPATSAMLAMSAITAPPIGRPIANVEVRVLDRDLRPVAPGAPGELYLGGGALARGYFGRPDLTAEAFLPDPSGRRPGDRLYRTGDRVRFRADGQLDFLGRADEQLKIRGFRIEPAEVEAALARHPAVRESAVRAWETGSGDRVLAAYFVPRGPEVPGPVELRAFLRRWLPEPMVPASFTALAALPLTPNGKLDRRHLPAPGLGPGARVPAAPRTPTEELLAEIWAEALGRERVEVHDDFFALGGHSLVAARMVARMREPLGVELPLAALFTHPTVAELAAEVDRARGRLGAMEPESALAGPLLVRRPEGAGDPPVSFAQEQLWFIDRLQPGNPVYNLPTAVRLDGALDRAALREALAKLVERQAVLRTAFGSVGGWPIQVVVPHLVPVLPEVDLTALSPAVREAEAARRVAAEALLPFDLAVAPLFRATLLRLEADRHLLPVTFHHSITDGWSLRVFYEELGAFYLAAVAGREADLPVLPVQYTDFASWQRERLRGEVLDRLLAYWRQRLAGAPAALDMPFDRPRPPVQTYGGTSQSLEVGAAAAQALRTFARGESATLFMTLFAAWAALLHRYSGEHDMVLGTPTANRSHPELEPLLGFFANVMPLRVDLSGDPTFRELVGRVRTVALADYTHQEMPFEKIVEELKPERDLSHHPIYQVVLALDTAARPDFLDLSGLRISPLPPTEGTAKYDLALYMDDRGGRLTGQLEANRDLVDRSTAARWLGHLTALAAAAVQDPARPLSELPFLSPDESRQLLAEVSRRVKIRGCRVDPLPVPEELPDRAGEPLPPAGAAERMVAEVWQELLGVEQVGLKDNFFALGGRSLLLLPMQEALERRFGVRIAIVDLFKFPSAGALAQYLSKAAASAAPVEPEQPVEPERPAEQVQERAERTRVAVGQGRFAQARRRMEAASRPPVPAADPRAEEEAAD